MSDEAMTYAQIAAINVNEHVEKKGSLSYLSWPWAVDQLLRLDELAMWEYGEPVILPDGTMMVFCTVTAFGKPRTMQLPVMDYKNRAIPHPDAFAINTAMHRCLVKAIALHGLGLYIYAGEDLPAGETAEKRAEPDPRREKLLADLKAVADEGLEAYKATWMLMAVDDKKLVGPVEHAAFATRAREADKAKIKADYAGEEFLGEKSHEDAGDR